MKEKKARIFTHERVLKIKNKISSSDACEPQRHRFLLALLLLVLLVTATVAAAVAAAAVADGITARLAVLTQRAEAEDATWQAELAAAVAAEAATEGAQGGAPVANGQDVNEAGWLPR